MPTLAAWTIYAFGVTAFAAGAWHLVSPATALKSLDLEEACVGAVNGGSFLSLPFPVLSLLFSSLRFTSCPTHRPL